MSEHWTNHTVAEELLSIVPILGRHLALYQQSAGEEEATMMQIKTLAHLIERPATVSDLARIRRVSLQSASVHIQNLVERGWVVRLPDPTDRRRFLLEVTPAGLVRAQEAKSELVEHLAGILNGLTPEEITAAQVFIPALKRSISKLTEHDAHAELHNAGE